MTKTRAVYISLFLILLTSLTCGCSKSNVLNSWSERRIDSLQIALEKTGYLFDDIRKDTAELRRELENYILEKDTLMILAFNEQLVKTYIEDYFFSAATPYLQEYLRIAEKIEHPLQIVTALNRLAQNYKALGLVDESMKYYFKAIVVSDNYEQPDSCMLAQSCITQLGAGSVCAQMGYHEEAFDFLSEACRLVRMLNDDRIKAEIFAVKGYVFQEKMMYDSAQHYFNRSLDLNIELNSKSGFAASHIHLGNMNIKRGNYPEALIFLNSAYKTLEHTSDLINFMKACVALGDAYIVTEEPQKAEKHLLEGLKVAEKLNLPCFFEDIHFKLSDCYKLQNKNRLAEEHRKQSYNYAEILNKDKVRTNLFNVYADHKKEKSQLYVKEMQTRYEAESKINQLYMIVSVVIAILLLVIMITYNRYLYMKKQKNLSFISLTQLKSDFYAQITDEFKTPATIISGLVEKLKKAIVHGPTKSNLIDLEVIERQSENLLLLMEEVLIISKLKYRDPDGLVNGNIVSYLRYLYNCFTAVAESRNINFLFHSSDDEIITDYFKDILKLSIDNLINATLDRCSANKQIMFMVRKDEARKKIIIEINDDCEMSVDEKLIEGLRSASWGDPKTEAEHVSQKNIMLTDQLVKNMKGRLVISSTVHNGTTFAIELPLIGKSKLSKKQPQTMKIPDTSPSIDREFMEIAAADEKIERGKPLILIVEDNRYMQFYLNSMLRGSYNVAFANDGKEGLDLANQITPDLIIADWMLPLLDGIKMSKAIKESVATSHIPIIMLTVKSSDEERIRAVRVGVDAFLNKPFIEEELKANIEQLLANRKDLRRKFNQVIIEDPENKNKQIDDAGLLFIQRVTDIIYHQISSDHLSSQFIASEMSMSVTQLNRKIKSISGLNTTSYILLVKLNKAKKMLVTTQKQIGEVAMDCGFGDFAYFSRTFKKEFGMTPSQFQRMHVEKSD